MNTSTSTLVALLRTCSKELSKSSVKFIRKVRAAGTTLGFLLLASAAFAQKSPATLPNIRFSRPGLVLAIALQDDGKVILGGYFSEVNGSRRNNIARLNPDGSVDETWNPGANDAVRQIVVNRADIFALGDFYTIGGQNRNGLAKLSTRGNGAADPLWNPAHPGNLHALALSGTDLYVGGLSYLSKLSTTGIGTGESPWGPQPDYNIFALAVHGTNLYVAGNFSQLGGVSRQRLARISTLGSTDVDPVWDPGVTGGNLGYVAALVGSGNDLYIGGSFDRVGGLPRKNIARLSLDGSGAPDPLWNPGTDREMVYALSISGGYVYVGGSFLQIGGLARSGVAKVSTAGTGVVDPLWQADTGGQWTTALMFRDGAVFAGGDFATINGAVSLSLVKLDEVSGGRDGSFATQVGYPGRVMTVARQNDGKVVIGGDFYLVSGLPRQNLVRFNSDGTVDQSWMPPSDGPVTDIAIQDANIFVAGFFGHIGNRPRRYLAKLSATGTDEVDATWNPDLSEPVGAIAIGTTNLYVASDNFSGSGTITKLSTTGFGQADPSWNPGRFECFYGNYFDKPVRALAANGDSLYVAGDFQWISRGTGYVAQGGLVKLSAAGEGVPDLQWHRSGEYQVRALTLDSTNLYVAPASGLVRLSAIGTGDADPGWHPDLVGGYVEVMAFSGTNLFAGGWVTTASGLTNATLVRLSTTGPGTVDSRWNPNPHSSAYLSPSVLGLAANGGDVYVIGNFDTIWGETRYSFAFLPVADAPAMAQSPNSTIFISRNPIDGADVTHFRITEIRGGNLYVSESLRPVKANEFITVEEGEAGLRLIGTGGAASVTAVSALSPTPDGTGSAETTLILNGEPGTCLLRFVAGEGLMLIGVAGRSYQIEYTEDLRPPINWLQLTEVSSTGGNMNVPGTWTLKKGNCFYRALLLP